MIRILAIGDVMGRPGRRALDLGLRRARSDLAPAWVVANGENAAGGFGINLATYREMTAPGGVDAVTMGNHWADNPGIQDVLNHAGSIVLPANMANVTNERLGLRILGDASQPQVALLNVVGRAFMKGENRCPFEAADRLIDAVPGHVKARIVDIHAEASSEKQALAHYLRGRVSCVYGTHSHCPTEDDRILGGYTGLLTDVGMTGPYDSVVGIDVQAAILRMRTGVRKNFVPAQGDLWFCALVIDICPTSGACLRLERIRWRLDQGHGSFL